MRSGTERSQPEEVPQYMSRSCRPCVPVLTNPLRQCFASQLRLIESCETSLESIEHQRWLHP
eukprot:6460297-Amphidinium_carterae.2